MDKYKYTVPVPMPKGAFETWANEYQKLQEQYFELQVETSGYEDALSVINRIKSK